MTRLRFACHEEKAPTPLPLHALRCGHVSYNEPESRAKFLRANRKADLSCSSMSRPITPRELERFFPNATSSAKRRNAVQSDPEDRAARPSATDAQPTQGNALVGPAWGEDSRWYGAATRFTLRFTVYAVRPADWDGWHVKELIDSLVAAEIIPDDGWQTVEEGCVATRKVDTAQEERTEIHIVTL